MTEQDSTDGLDHTDEMATDTVDVVGALEAARGQLYAEAGPLYLGFVDGISGGARVVQDGNFIALSQGVDYQDRDRVTVGHELTPTEARSLANMFQTAADNADNRVSETDRDKEERKSLLKLVVGVITHA